ncbi:chemotaxis protein CheX [Aquabacterium sp. G14]|uniref:chemotaxis protein CheX n=1 Tax=Aquabacterium sp. G14 TaxID=3130164 RepID=UPI0030B5B2BC
MSDEKSLISKVLVLENNKEYREKIRAFCDAHHLQALRVQEDNLMSVLRSNVDLGAIMISEVLGENPQAGINLAKQIHYLRPELPIFLRRTVENSDRVLSDAEKGIISASYTIETIDRLKDVIETSIFSLVYPSKLVRGIVEITQSSLQSQFKGLDVTIDTPYIVRDRLIFGEIFTLIPVESEWCRGYMTLQAEEAPLLTLVKRNKTHITPVEGDDFRNLNGILGEITNLIWGAFKNRYTSFKPLSAHLSQVPIVINHMHRYISFGSVNPQLCFKCVLTDAASPEAPPFVIYQRFVFNLSWSPEDFHENEQSFDSLVNSGELELF